MNPQNIRQNLECILSLLECPKCHRGSLIIIDQDISVGGLACEACGALFPCRGGILDLLTKEEKNSVVVQKALGKRDAKLYDALIARGSFRRFFSSWSFQREVEQTISLFDLHPEHIVLDIGCGTGNYTLEFAQRTNMGVAIGLDLSSAMLELCKRNISKAKMANVLLVRANAGNLPFREKSLSRAYLGCLHLIQDIDLTLSNAYRVLTPGGILSGMTFFASGTILWRRIQEILTKMLYSHPFDKVALQEHVAKTGFVDFQCDVRRYGQFRAVKPS